MYSKLLIVGGVLAAAVAFSALFAFVAQLLWNWIAFGVFGLPELSFFQMWGLLFLLQLIFSGLRSTVTVQK